MTKPDAKAEANTVWPKPTRRAFVGMLGAAAAVLTLPRPGKAAEPPPAPLPLWIGHV